VWIAGTVAVLFLAAAGAYAYLWLEVDALRGIPAASRVLPDVSVAPVAAPVPSAAPPAPSVVSRAPRAPTTVESADEVRALLVPPGASAASSPAMRAPAGGSDSPLDQAGMYPVPIENAARAESHRDDEKPRDPALVQAEIEKSMAQSRAAFEAFRAAASRTPTR